MGSRLRCVYSDGRIEQRSMIEQQIKARVTKALESIEPETVIRDENGEVVTKTYDGKQVQDMLEKMETRFEAEIETNLKDLRSMDNEILQLRKIIELYEEAMDEAGIEKPLLDSDERIAADLTTLIWEGPLSFVDDHRAKEELLVGFSKLLNRKAKLDEKRFS